MLLGRSEILVLVNDDVIEFTSWNISRFEAHSGKIHHLINQHCSVMAKPSIHFPNKACEREVRALCPRGTNPLQFFLPIMLCWKSGKNLTNVI